MVPFFKALFQHFANSNTTEKGAALAYYAVFSLLPMIMIVISVLGLLFGQQAVSGEIFSQLQPVLGADGATQLQEAIKSQHTNHNGWLTAIIGFLTLALSASAMFTQLHSSLNAIWEIEPPAKSSILIYLSKHISAFSILITLFFILLLSTSIHGFLSHHAASLPAASSHLVGLEHLVSFLLLAVFFALLFRFLGDADFPWSTVLVGGSFTALLFMLGKVGIGLYIGHSHVGTTFGSASVLALLMLWIYYTSQIIFLGASFVKVYHDQQKES